MKFKHKTIPTKCVYVKSKPLEKVKVMVNGNPYFYYKGDNKCHYLFNEILGDDTNI